MKLGIVGLPNVGKSTLFNSMTLGKAEAANYPFCTIDPNVGVVPVPDERLARLTEMYDSAKTTPAVIEFVDIAGLVRGASNEFVGRVREYAAAEHNEVFVLCAKIEEEISDLDEADKKEFLAELGVETSGLDRLIAASYKLLGLISYLTAGPQESRAWTITKGTKAPQAAGKIHSDFERGFIRAEVVHYDDLMRLGSYNAAKEQGLVRSEGKEYVMKDGDVVLFRFNV